MKVLDRKPGYGMVFGLKVEALTARAALDQLWHILVNVPIVFPPGQAAQYFHVYGPGLGRMIPVPKTKGDLAVCFADVINTEGRYSERPDGRADLSSNYKPACWPFKLYTDKHGGTSRCSFQLGPVDWSRNSQQIVLLESTKAAEQATAFRKLITVVDPVLADLSPGYWARGGYKPSPDNVCMGTGWLTYINSPDREVSAYDWGPVSVTQFWNGYLFEAVSPDPDTDPDLFDRIKQVRDRIRTNGDILRRRDAINVGADPDALPPPPPDPEYVLKPEGYESFAAYSRRGRAKSATTEPGEG